VDILGDIPTIQQIYEEGIASVGEADRDGMVGLAMAAHMGRDTILLWIKKQGAKFILGKDSHLVLMYICRDNEGYNDCIRSDEAMVVLLVKTIILLGAPPNFDLYFHRHHKLIDKGRQLRAQLPAHLEERRALIVTHCPLPTVLQTLVAAYADPTNADVWESGLL
jgi:hypothetical protein